MCDLEGWVVVCCVCVVEGGWVGAGEVVFLPWVYHNEGGSAVWVGECLVLMTHH